MEVGEREIIYLSLHCHHQNDFCIKVGSDESHFNVSVTVRLTKTQDRVHRPHLFGLVWFWVFCLFGVVFEEKGEPKRIRTELPLAYQPIIITTPHR